MTASSHASREEGGFFDPLISANTAVTTRLHTSRKNPSSFALVAFRKMGSLTVTPYSMAHATIMLTSL